MTHAKTIHPQPYDYEATLSAVRHLSQKHNLPAPAPAKKKRRVRGLAERLGWKSNPDVLRILRE